MSSLDLEYFFQDLYILETENTKMPKWRPESTEMGESVNMSKNTNGSGDLSYYNADDSRNDFNLEAMTSQFVIKSLILHMPARILKLFFQQGPT